MTVFLRPALMVAVVFALASGGHYEIVQGVGIGWFIAAICDLVRLHAERSPHEVPR
jgi:hypothetical protein